MSHRFNHNSHFLKVAVAVAALTIAVTARAQTPGTGSTASSPGITDTEIVLGNSGALSGPNAGYGPVSLAQGACYDYLNAEFGGIKMGDGKIRKVKYVMYDDALEPARALENARRLVSQDHVFAVVGNLGTGANLAARGFYNAEKVPQVFLSTGGPMWGAKAEVQKFPWTMGGWLAYNTEAAIYAAFIKEKFPNAKVALFNDPSGGPFFATGFLKAAKELGLNIVIHEQHQYSEPTIDAKIDRLAASGADVFVDATTPKFVVQALKRMAAINWKPTHIIWGVGSSIGGVLQPAGSDISKGVYTGLWLKDQADPGYAKDEDMKLYVEKLKQYASRLNPADQNAAAGWHACHAVKSVLERTKQPNRQAFMDAARSMSSQKVPLLLKGITLNTNGEQDGYPIEAIQMGQYDGTKYVPVGGLINYEGKTPTP
jgi:branched-chain amino acid transport system substrate-binding protein